MKTCGSCTLCCKVPKINDLNKPANQWCLYCKIGEGCAIYDNRPKVCQDFNCLWLMSEMPESFRPDRVGFFVTTEGDVAKVSVDAATPSAWHDSPIIDELRNSMHVIVQVGNQVTFLSGRGLAPPERILLDWAL